MVGAYEKPGQRVKARVAPSFWELFEHQSQDYKDEVIQPTVERVAVEQAARFGWQRYASSRDAIIGMRTFGASAPLKELTKKFGFSVEPWLSRQKRDRRVNNIVRARLIRPRIKGVSREQPTC